MPCTIDTAPPPAISQKAPAKSSRKSGQSSSDKTSAETTSSSGSEATAQNGPVTQTIEVKVYNVTPDQEAYRLSRVVVPDSTRYSLKAAPAKQYHVFMLAGVSPTAYKVSDNICNPKTLTCTVTVERKSVFDIGGGASYTTTSGTSLGIIGTAQGNIYGTFGFSF